MSGAEAGAEVAISRRRGDCCNGLLEWRSRGLLPVLLGCLWYVGIYGDVAHGYIDAYQQLINYGFPIGLLPHIVTGYDLAENGKFAVYLDSKCEIDIPSAFPVVYSKKISGKLAYGSLKDLSGIQVKIYYFWLTINAITVQGDNLKFEVGLISASYPIHPNFDENPDCVNTVGRESEPLGYLEDRSLVVE